MLVVLLMRHRGWWHGQSCSVVWSVWEGGAMEGRDRQWRGRGTESDSVTERQKEGETSGMTIWFIHFYVLLLKKAT